MFIEAHAVSILQQFILRSPITIAVAVFLARWLIIVFPCWIAFLFFKGRGKDRHAAVEAVWSLMLTLVVTALIAAVVQRARPFLTVTDLDYPITRLIPAPLNTSFPSGHTGAAVTMACVIFWMHRRSGLVAFACATFVALGRVLVGVHFPTDILGGMMVGLISFIMVRTGHRQIRRKDIAESARQHHHV